jgi:hypothetical protein
MSKKKGQKWGMNNSKNKNTDINYYAGITGSSTEVSHHVVDSKIAENGSCGLSDPKVGDGIINNSESVKTIADEEKSSGGPLDFKIFFPLMQLPKVLLLFELCWEIVLITSLVNNLSKFQKTTTISTVVSQNYNIFSPFQKTITFCGI